MGKANPRVSGRRWRWSRRRFYFVTCWLACRPPRGILGRCFVGDPKWVPRQFHMGPLYFEVARSVLTLFSTNSKAIACHLMGCRPYRPCAPTLARSVPGPVSSLPYFSLPFAPLVPLASPPAPPAPFPLCLL